MLGNWNQDWRTQSKCRLPRMKVGTSGRHFEMPRTSKASLLRQRAWFWASCIHPHPQFVSPRPIFMLSFYLFLGFLSGYFLGGVPINILNGYLVFPIWAASAPSCVSVSKLLGNSEVVHYVIY
jgi:hypothetical protein